MKSNILDRVYNNTTIDPHLANPTSHSSHEEWLWIHYREWISYSFSFFLNPFSRNFLSFRQIYFGNWISILLSICNKQTKKIERSEQVRSSCQCNFFLPSFQLQFFNVFAIQVPTHSFTVVPQLRIFAWKTWNLKFMIPGFFFVSSGF